jgi:hypothetical protein
VAEVEEVEGGGLLAGDAVQTAGEEREDDLG